MGVGLGNIGVQQRRPPSGAPFPANAANNGLSVDAVTGKIVLGNDVGGNTAQLLSIREIPINTFGLRLIGASGQGNAQQIDIDAQADYIFTATNISALHRTERFMRGYMAKASTGGTNMLGSWGRDVNNCVEVGHNMETTATGYRLGSYISSRGAAPDMNVNAATAGRILFTVNDSDPSVATLAGLIFTNGNVRISSNQTDGGSKFQVRGTGGNIFSLESSAGTVVLLSTNAGQLSIAAQVARSSVGTVLIRNNGNQQIQQITGVSGTILPVFTSITVVDGVITNITP